MARKTTKSPTRNQLVRVQALMRKNNKTHAKRQAKARAMLSTPAGIDVDLEMAEQIAATEANVDWEPQSIMGECCIKEPDANEIDDIVGGVLKGSGELTPPHREKLRRAIVERLVEYLNGLAL